MELLIQKMQTLTNQASQEKIILMKHQQIIKKIMASNSNNRMNNRITTSLDIKCCFINCPKKSSYYLNNNYDCWFHNIDVNLKG